MANHTTGAERYNARMDKIFAKSKELNEKYHGKDSFGTQAKTKAIHAKMGEKKGKSEDVFAKNKRKATSTPMHAWLSKYE